MRTSRRSFPRACPGRAALLLLPLALAPALGAAPAPIPVAPLVAALARPSAAGSLAAALDTVDPDAIRADVHFIASDELGGRDTPSLGQRVAARFLCARLARLGWQPGARDGYLHRYELDEQRLDPEASQLVLEAVGAAKSPATLRFGRDYFLRSTFDLAELDAQAEVVFAGAGSEADFASPAFAGRWALCLEEDLSARTVRGLARDAGALGVLIAPAPTYAGESYAERHAGTTARLLAGRVSYPDDGEQEAPREIYPLCYLTSGAADELFALAGVEAAARARLAPGTVLSVRAHERRALAGEGGRVEVENVVGFWPGSDPELARETILVSAHYDHVGIEDDGDVFNGADDNGSGTCGLLALAETLARHGPLRRSVALIWVSGEEKGLWGSDAWVKEAWLPGEAKPICDINLDMIGRNDPASLLVTPTSARPRDYNGLVRRIEQLAPLEGFTELGSADEYYNRSDHKNFAKLGIPVTFLFADVHADYHKPSDTADKLDYDKVRRVVRLVLRVIDDLQADELDL